MDTQDSACSASAELVVVNSGVESDPFEITLTQPAPGLSQPLTNLQAGETVSFDLDGRAPDEVRVGEATPEWTVESLTLQVTLPREFLVGTTTLALSTTCEEVSYPLDVDGPRPLVVEINPKVVGPGEPIVLTVADIEPSMSGGER